jgi:hypothetical protein
MNKYLKYILSSMTAILLFVVCGYFVAQTSVVQAAIQQLGLRTQTATATTTVAYMTPGTASTTITVDNSLNTPNEMSLYVQLTSSTTATVLNWEYEYSMDQIDWWDEDLTPTSVAIADTQVQHSSTTITHVWNPGDANASTSNKVFIMPNKYAARYSRVVFTLPIGVDNGALWAEVVPIKERN